MDIDIEIGVSIVNCQHLTTMIDYPGLSNTTVSTATHKFIAAQIWR